MEDILTSNVFGALKYFSPESALVPFLSKASFAQGEKPFEDLSANVKVEYKFWPWVQESDCDGCEPDVLLRITCPNDRKFLVVVEAKYRPGKSSKEEAGEHPNDQLAREWENLKRLAEKELCEPLLIYLTADVSYPAQDIEASQRELANKNRGKARISWLSWRHLPALITDDSPEMLRDLAEVLRRLNLTFFQGFSTVEEHPSIQWTFSGPPVYFEWIYVSPEEPLRWRFQ
ncbi:MAG: hypothetical protein KGL31_06475 [candidate division NC10 bacterium]|nr:hypothetical protein [candidate division NC10 bacterium]